MALEEGDFPADGDGEDLEWLSDYVLAFLKSPTWVTPIAQFVDERCIIFDFEEENKLEYTACHRAFKELIDSLLAVHLLELSVTREQFERFCQTGIAGNRTLHRVLVEQLLSADDFLTFKAMMAKRNADLYREALKQLEGYQDGEDDEVPAAAAAVAAEAASAATAAAAAAVAEDDDPASRDVHGSAGHEEDDLQAALDKAAAEGEWSLYEDQLFEAIHNSQEEEDSQRRAEEAELEQAIALSLQVEEERLRHLAAGDEVPMQDVPAPLAPEAAALTEPAAADKAPSAAPLAARAPLRPVIPRVLRMQPLNAKLDTAPLPDAAGLAAEIERMRCEAILQRERAERAMTGSVTAAPPAGSAASEPPAAPAAPAARQQPTEEERRQRAEHLRRHRELLVEKRNKERQRQLGEYQQAQQLSRRRADGSDGPETSSQAVSGSQLVAELTGRGSSGAAAAPLPDAAAAAAQMRQALTVQLRQTLTRAMPGAGAGLDDQLQRLEEMRRR